MANAALVFDVTPASIMEIVPIAIVRAFVNAINLRSPDAIAGLMTDDHVFIDSLGMRVTGREPMRKGWEGYFRMVPDYSIAIDETFAEGSVVVVLGAAQGTYSPGGPLKPENRWRTPAAWRAVVRGSLLAEWRVYADNEPIRRIMAASGPSSAAPAEPPTNPARGAP
jgi:ketosteroid isomerase-like protein